MKYPMTTLCYIEQEDKYLMMHRIRKEHDVNRDKWIGIGGHFEEGESPEECLLREVREETGLNLTSYRFRGLVTFVSDCWDAEYMCLYTAEAEPKSLTDCREGVLEWVPKTEIAKLNLWEGDKIFLKLLAQKVPFFSLKLRYEGEVLREAVLDGQEMELLDICDLQGNPTGKVSARCIAHTAGLPHRTVHIWVVRRLANGKWQVLLQKRSKQKNSFPGCLDVSSAGHVSAGDTCEESARRELWEELGIRAEPGELDYVGRFDSGDILAEFDGETFHDREISAVYIYRRMVDADALQLQTEEVDSVLWMDYEECLARVLDGTKGFCVNIRGIRLVGEYLRNMEKADCYPQDGK